MTIVWALLGWCVLGQAQFGSECCLSQPAAGSREMLQDHRRCCCHQPCLRCHPRRLIQLGPKPTLTEQVFFGSSALGSPSPGDPNEIFAAPQPWRSGFAIPLKDLRTLGKGREGGAWRCGLYQRWTRGCRFGLMAFPLAVCRVSLLVGQGKSDLKAVTTLCTVKRLLPNVVLLQVHHLHPHQPLCLLSRRRDPVAANLASAISQPSRRGACGSGGSWAALAEKLSAAFIHQPVNTVVQALLQLWFSHRGCGGCSFPAGVGQAAGGCNCFSHPTLIHLCS